MLAYHNDPAVKTKYVNRMKAHMEADALIQGAGWDGRKGCAIGCTFEAYDHARGPVEIGVPETLLWLEDAIFKGLPYRQAKGFPLEFLVVIPVGADLSLVWPQFALWILADPDHGMLRHCNDDTRPAVEAVADLYRRWIDGDKPSAEEFEAAAWAVWTAAEEAARAAAEAAVWSARAVWTAAEAAAGAAWAVARAAWAAAGSAWAARAARAAARAAAWNEFWIAARDELLRLLREAPVVE